MAIIISSNGKKAVKVDKSAFEKEDALQKYIYENPESIPLYEIKEDIRLLILAREFPTNSGPIDAIGIDKNGELYIVETKLYKNPDKRTVIGQSLDYGAALWKHSNDFSEFLNILDSHTQKVFGLMTAEKIKEFFKLSDEEVFQTLDNARSNLNGGVYHFVILMDKLDDRLKDLVLFVNQNSQFDIYAVQFEYYKYEEYEIIIPKIFGAEVKKDISVSNSNSSRRKWDEQTMFENAKQKLNPDELKQFEKIYNFSKENADVINFGTGSYATFSPIFEKLCSKSLFTLGSDKRLSFNFEWIGKDNLETRDRFKEGLEKIGFKFREDYEGTRPGVTSEEWMPKTDEFIKILQDLLSN